MQQKIVGEFFPNSYQVNQVLGSARAGYEFELRSQNRSAECPSCKQESHHWHGYQSRTVMDLPILCESMTLHIAQSRFLCENQDCSAGVFTELNEFVSPYFHFTERCRKYMLNVATVFNCESASRILKYQGVRVSGDTLLNMVKSAGSSYERKAVTKIGVDDWAYRKGQEYGTIICDLETHEIIEILKGRDKDTFEEWLRGNPEIEVVSRDRASAYASAVNNVLPEAVQIADRFHITKNLLDALNDTMKAFLPEKIEIPDAEPDSTAANPTVKKTIKRSSVKTLKPNGVIK